MMIKDEVNAKWFIGVKNPKFEHPPKNLLVSSEFQSLPAVQKLNK